MSETLLRRLEIEFILMLFIIIDTGRIIISLCWLFDDPKQKKKLPANTSNQFLKWFDATCGEKIIFCWGKSLLLHRNICRAVVNISS